MNTNDMAHPVAEISAKGGASKPSPKSIARSAGLCSLFEALTNVAGQMVILGNIVVLGDAPATAANVLEHPVLLQIGFALSLISVLFHIAWALLVHDLFRIVNKGVSRFALLVMVVGSTIQALVALFYIAPLFVLRGSYEALSAPQLNEIASILFTLNGRAFNLYLVFFGAWCAATGYLMFSSTFMPRVFGALLIVSGIGWMTFLLPLEGIKIFPAIAVASGIGEIPLMLWLLIKGVNSERWHEQARQASALEGSHPQLA